MPSDTTYALPTSIALVDDDVEYTEFLAQHLRSLGVQVHRFADSTDLLADTAPFSYGFYLVDLMLPGIDGVELIRVLRRRTHAGVLVVSGRVADDVFSSVVDAGADMHLAKPVTFDQVVVAIRAVHRRVVATEAGSKEWVLDRHAGQLVAPDGVRVDLSEGDLMVMECFVEADGQTVTREALCRRLGRPVTDEPDNTLSATLYRLRRRIERATPVVVPMQSQSRVGYIFRAPLRSV
ncbi:MAG: response regulator transcription factor [Pseudomonadota bacterium]